jgi:GNAT superfamily N-acetyltransferase
MSERYEISTDPARMQIDEIWGYLRRSYWSPDIRREVTQRAVDNSICAGAFEKASGRQIGFARAASDRATFAWLCDVYVLEEHRGQGLSKAMVRALVEHPDLQTLRRWLLATRDAHGLYKQFGFLPVEVDRWMELKLPASAWKQT